MRKAEKSSDSKDCFAIFQLKNRPETRDFRFESMENLNRRGLAVKREHYELIYTGRLPRQDDVSTVLEELFAEFNAHRPRDFSGHSLSVSDVIVLRRNGKITSHYCDSIGFVELPDFYNSEQCAEYQKKAAVRDACQER